MPALVRQPKNHRVELSFSGQMTQDPAAFFEELTSAAKSVRSPDGGWSLLVDFSDTHVMSQDRAQNTIKIFEWCKVNGIVKIAFILQSVTQRLQIKRVSGNSELVEVFDSQAKAVNWLESPAEEGTKTAIAG